MPGKGYCILGSYSDPIKLLTNFDFELQNEPEYDMALTLPMKKATGLMMTATVRGESEDN